VRSIEEALHFYEDQLGLRVTLRETVPAEQVSVAMLPAGDSRVELLEPTAPARPSPGSSTSAAKGCITSRSRCPTWPRRSAA